MSDVDETQLSLRLQRHIAERIDAARVDERARVLRELGSDRARDWLAWDRHGSPFVLLSSDEQAGVDQSLAALASLLAPEGGMPNISERKEAVNKPAQNLPQGPVDTTSLDLTEETR